MKSIVIALCCCAVACSVADEKKVLQQEVLYQMMDRHNPYVASLIANQNIQEGKFIYTQGEFDTKLGAKHDEKQYPLGDGRLSDVYLEKPMENGTDIMFGYRKAYGVQEYNNIKTGDDGEFRVGVKIPVVPLVHGTNQRSASLKIASLHSKQAKFESKKGLRELYATVMGIYYQLLFRHELMVLERGLLEKAQQQYRLMEKRVSVGDEALIVLVEAQQLVNEREQRWIESRNEWSTIREGLLRYLNLSSQEFEERFELPPLPLVVMNNLPIEATIDKMVQNSPRIAILELQKAQLQEESALAEILNYPQFDAAVYGVHDRLYDNGFKVSLEMALPIERRKFQGKRYEIESQKNKNSHEMKKVVLEAKKDMTVALETLQALYENYTFALKECDLAEQLEHAERRKFELGQSGLFLLNQREMKTLQVKQKKAFYHLKIVMNELEIEKETGGLDQYINPFLE